MNEAPKQAIRDAIKVLHPDAQQIIIDEFNLEDKEQ